MDGSAGLRPRTGAVTAALSLRCRDGEAEEGGGAVVCAPVRGSAQQAAAAGPRATPAGGLLLRRPRLRRRGGCRVHPQTRAGEGLLPTILHFLLLTFNDLQLVRQVEHLDAQAPFPASGGTDTLYVKLSWDTKTFRVVDSSVLNPGAPDASPGRHGNPSLPPSPPSSPPAAAPASRRPAGRALPTPDLTVLRRAATLKVPCGKAPMSAGGAGPAEAESLHSATKLSASKCLSARRRDAAARTPGVRKRLELSGERPSRTPGDVCTLRHHVRAPRRCFCCLRRLSPPFRSRQDVDPRGCAERAPGRGARVGRHARRGPVLLPSSGHAPQVQAHAPHQSPAGQAGRSAQPSS